jgi:hypothetical protein
MAGGACTELEKNYWTGPKNFLVTVLAHIYDRYGFGRKSQTVAFKNLGRRVIYMAFSPEATLSTARKLQSLYGGVIFRAWLTRERWLPISTLAAAAPTSR